MIVTHLIVSMNSPVSFSNIISMEDIKAESADGAKERERLDICTYIKSFCFNDRLIESHQNSNLENIFSICS